VQIAKIYEGGTHDVDAQGPLSMPGVDVNEGDYLLAVNGRPVDAGESPYKPFLGQAGRLVTLTVSDQPELDDENEGQRTVTIRPIPNETPLRFRAWIEHNRQQVLEASDGRVGYIYVPNTGVQGQNELFRQFYGQMHMPALVIDERWNGGGQIPTRFIELLNRPTTNYWARRHGRDWKWPPDGHSGPKAMLINGLAGSGGDMFPWLFREADLGPLIGTRTWGGLVGISTVPGLIDSGYTAVPNFGFYETDGTWGIEGHGVDPDIEVVDDPAKMQDNLDPQLQAAIDYLVTELDEGRGYSAPERPAPPDRRGVGIAEEDK
jgi:tricorn protease